MHWWEAWDDDASGRKRKHAEGTDGREEAAWEAQLHAMPLEVPIALVSSHPYTGIEFCILQDTTGCCYVTSRVPAGSEARGQSSASVCFCKD